MIPRDKHIICTTPWLVETKKNTKFKVWKKKNAREFEEVTLDGGGPQHYFFACRDQEKNVMLIDMDFIYWVHYAHTGYMPFDSLFTMCRKADKMEIDMLLKKHRTLKISIKS